MPPLHPRRHPPTPPSPHLPQDPTRRLALLHRVVVHVLTSELVAVATGEVPRLQQAMHEGASALARRGKRRAAAGAAAAGSRAVVATLEAGVEEALVAATELAALSGWEDGEALVEQLRALLASLRSTLDAGSAVQQALTGMLGEGGCAGRCSRCAIM